MIWKKIELFFLLFRSLIGFNQGDIRDVSDGLKTFMDDTSTPQKPAPVIVDAGGRVTVAFPLSSVTSMSLPA